MHLWPYSVILDEHPCQILRRPLTRAHNAPQGGEEGLPHRPLPRGAAVARQQGKSTRALLFALPRQRADGFAMLETFLETAQLLGAGVYVYHGPPRLRGNNPPLDRWQPHIEEAIARCRAHGVRLCWETVSWAWLNSMERIEDFKRRWPELGFTLDVKQVMELGLDPARVAERMGERLCHVHMLDYDENGRHALPGRGSSDFRAFSKALRAVEYQGDIILEPYAGQTEDTGEVLRSLEWLRETFHAE